MFKTVIVPGLRRNRYFTQWFKRIWVFDVRSFCGRYSTWSLLNEPIIAYIHWSGPFLSNILKRSDFIYGKFLSYFQWGKKFRNICCNRIPINCNVHTLTAYMSNFKNFELYFSSYFKIPGNVGLCCEFGSFPKWDQIKKLLLRSHGQKITKKHNLRKKMLKYWQILSSAAFT